MKNDKNDKNLEKIYNSVSETYETKSVKIIIRRDDGRIKLPSNVMVFQEFALTAAIYCTGNALRILMYLFSASGYENLIGIDIKTISESLNIKEVTIKRALKELTKYNVINKFRNTGDRRRNDYFINPVAAWRGNSNARRKFLCQVENKNQLKLFPEDNAN